MVLITRNIEAVKISEKPYQQQAHLVLEHVAGQKLIGLLKQIGQLSDFAGDIFANLLKDATATSQRVSSLTQRVAKVEAIAPQVQQMYKTSRPIHFFGGVKGGSELNRVDPGHTALFVPESMPAPIARVRSLAAAPPQLAILDSFAGKSCLAQYSDPSFFFGQWLKAEDEKAQKLMAENQAKKAARKKKKKKVAKQPKMVAAVQVKTYSAQGAEFVDQNALAAQRAAAAQNAGTQALSPEEYEEEEERAGPSTSTGPRIQAPTYDYSAQQQTTNYINSLPPEQKPQPGTPSSQSQSQHSQQYSQQGPASPVSNTGGSYAPPPPLAPYNAPPPQQGGYAPPPPLAPYDPSLAAAPQPPQAPPAYSGYAPPPPVIPMSPMSPEAPPMAPAYGSPPPVAPVSRRCSRVMRTLVVCVLIRCCCDLFLLAHGTCLRCACCSSDGASIRRTCGTG